MFPKRLLATANSTYTSMQEGMKILASVVGAGLFVWIGGGWIGVVDAVTFFVAAVVLSRIRVREPRPEPTEQNWRREYTEGFRHLSTVVLLRRVVFACGVLMLTAGFVTTAMFGVVDSDLHRALAFLGVVSSTQGVGSVVGGLVARPWRPGGAKGAW